MRTRDDRKFNSKRDIASLIHETRQWLGYAHRIRWGWGNGNMTSTMGFANAETRLVWFSPRLWRRASSKQRRQTIIHEVCHIVAGVGVRAHGPEWRQLMRQCGVKPARCHNVKTFKRRGRRRRADIRQADSLAIPTSFRYPQPRRGLISKVLDWWKGAA